MRGCSPGGKSEASSSLVESARRILGWMAMDEGSLEREVMVSESESKSRSSSS